MFFTGFKFALCGTSLTDAGEQKMIAAMEDALTGKGVTVLGSYNCRDKFLVFTRDRLRTEDLENAKKVAQDTLRKIGTGKPWPPPAPEYSAPGFLTFVNTVNYFCFLLRLLRS